MDLPTTELLNAFVQLAGAVMAIIALTGLGKYLADKAGFTIDGNQVRFVTAVVATIVAVGAAVLGGSIPGIGPFPTAGGAQAWLIWILAATPPLTLFANTVWRYVYKPEPDPTPTTAPPADPGRYTNLDSGGRDAADFVRQHVPAVRIQAGARSDADP